jgi:hypothetical protein
VKKTTFLILMIAAFAVFRISAQNAPIATLGTVYSDATTVIVPITAANFINIGSADLKFLYDPAVVSATAVTVNPTVGGTIAIDLNTPGIVYFGWFRFQGSTMPDGSEIFYITFTRTLPLGTTTLVWDDTPGGQYCEWYTGDFQTLIDQPASEYYVNGLIAPFDFDGPVTLAPNLQACPGTQIQVPIRVRDFENVGAVSLHLTFDPLVLSYVGFSNTSGYPGLAAENPLPGIITTAGFAPPPPGATSGVYLPYDAILYTLTFTYLGGTTNLAWNDDIHSCEYANWPDYYAFNDIPQADFYIDGSISQNQQGVNLTLFLEGLYNTTTNQMNKTHDFDGSNTVPKYPGTIADMITVELRDPNNYDAVILQVNNIPLHQDGSAGFSIAEPLSGSYYITIKTRNHLETVSAMPVSFDGLAITYDFRNAASQAFGNNMKYLEPGICGIYAGDVNQDGIINLSDRQLINDQYLVTTRGYFPTDINGDGIINLSDRQIANDAYLQTITANTP